MENSGNIDDNGHGTFVAGVVGGALFGVAKDVRLIAVKVNRFHFMSLGCHIRSDAIQYFRR